MFIRYKYVVLLEFWNLFPQFFISCEQMLSLLSSWILDFMESYKEQKIEEKKFPCNFLSQTTHLCYVHALAAMKLHAQSGKTFWLTLKHRKPWTPEIELYGMWLCLKDEPNQVTASNFNCKQKN